MKEKNVWKSSFIFAGAFVSMCVGASFGTGQELLQFFASYGVFGALGAILAVLASAALLFVGIHDARKYKITSGEKLFIHYGGNIIGRILYWFTILSMLLSASLLLSGAGTTMNLYFGVPPFIGSLLVAVFVTVSVLLGLNRLVDILGRLAVLIILFMVVVSLISILHPVDGFTAGSALALADTEVYRPAGNWLMSGFMYFTWCIIIFAAYATNLASQTTESVTVQNRGLILGHVGFAACASFPTLAIVANYSVAGSSAIPNIALARMIHPVLGVFFSIVVIICIYTTICPYLWTVAFSVAKTEDCKRYKVVSVVCIIIGLLGSFMGSFQQIVSVVTGLSARVGYVYLACMIFTKLFRKIPVSAD